MTLPEKLKHKLLTPSQTDDDRDGWMDTICPFHHSSNGGGIKKLNTFSIHSPKFIPTLEQHVMIPSFMINALHAGLKFQQMTF